MTASRVARPAESMMPWAPVLERVREGARFAGMHASSMPTGTRLTVVLAEPERLVPFDVLLDAADQSYPALTPYLPAATWYERAIADLHGTVPVNHPRPEPLVLPLGDHDRRPRPGTSPDPPMVVVPDEHVMRAHVHGEGLFMLTYGPVRSGVMESVEYVIETPGEDIPHLRVRVYAKHRGVQSRFSGISVDDGVLLAERVEGIASVAHATAFCQAVESATDVAVPPAAAVVRTLHAELERIANHVDVAMRLTDAAALHVATARMGWHKERVLRLVSRLCGSRFGRTVVRPGGVHRLPLLGLSQGCVELAGIGRRLLPDLDALMRTPSFLDRLRTTGPLRAERAVELAALGPVGRASGFDDDDRLRRPYAGYGDLVPTPAVGDDGDAQARMQVRADEIADSLRLCREAFNMLERLGADAPVAVPIPADRGRALGWAEAPQGEVYYDVEVDAGRVVRACPRSASMHNLSLFHEVFAGDIFTDFPFIEASFGISVAGVVG